MSTAASTLTRRDKNVTIVPLPPPSTAVSYKRIKLGQVPVEAVNKALGRNLKAGRASVSPKAHKHMAEDHPDDYPVVREVLADVLAAPDYVGYDAPSKPGQARDNFYLVKAVPAGTPGLPPGAAVPPGQAYVLVAVSLAPDAQGQYRVVSGYCISQITVNNREGATPVRLHKV